MSKRSAPAARAGASKRHNKVRKQELVEIEYDNEWYLGEVTKEIADGGVRVYFLVDQSTVVIPRKERAARIRKPSSAAMARFDGVGVGVGKRKHLGNYATEEEAARAYDAEGARLGQELNFPDE